jgi:prepilin-type N-terminal cleavage/methylation domain-containing protein
MAKSRLKINQISIRKKSKKAGFTFVEVLVSLAVFSIMMGAILSVFVSAVKAQRRVLAEQQILDQVSYGMEYTSRLLRMVKKDLWGNCITQGSNYETTTASTIRFLDYQNKCHELYIENGQLKEKKSSNNSSANFQPALPLTSANFTVNSFKITGAGWIQGLPFNSDNIQPSVTLFFEIFGKDNIKVQIQTTISQRNLDVQY